VFLLSNIQTLYDGSASGKQALHRNMDILVEGGRISQVTPHQKGRDMGKALSVVDCSKYTVTPGLIDCHGHIAICGIEGNDLDRMNGPEGLLIVEKILYTSLVKGGVTTIRDVGGATHLMKRLVDEGVMIGPRLKIAICMLSTTGGHADFRGPDRCHAQLSRLWPPGPGRPSSIVDGPWECRKRVREIAACGADLIKICASPGVASPGDKLEHREFTSAEIEAICDEAEARGLRVAAHAHSSSGINMAIDGGVHDIQHISLMGEAEVEKAYARGCTVTPTSWVMERILQEPDLDPFVLEKAKRVGESHAAAVVHARSGGLKILAGSDSVFPDMHGRHCLEIASLIKDGLTPLEAWHGATGLAADEIGQNDSGTLVVGQRADLLICKGDVVHNPGLIADEALLEVVKDGQGYRGMAGIRQRSFASDAKRFLAR